MSDDADGWRGDRAEALAWVAGGPTSTELAVADLECLLARARQAGHDEGVAEIVATRDAALAKVQALHGVILMASSLACVVDPPAGAET